jgi:hypothetical protein
MAMMIKDKAISAIGKMTVKKEKELSFTAPIPFVRRVM